MSLEPIGPLSFGTFTVDAAAREVRLRGEAQSVAPKVFDLLLHLVRNAGRVVTRDELEEQVWKHHHLTDSVVARTVMLARKAIGDDGQLIRTVHRVGYRFERPAVAEPAAAGEPAPAALGSAHVTPAPPGPGRPRILLLPIENRTGEDQYGWVELGLLSLLIRALDAGGLLEAVPIASVLGALQAQSVMAETDAQLRARTVGKLLGATWVAAPALDRKGDSFVLRLRLNGPAAATHSVAVDAADPGVLGASAARAAETLICGANDMEPLPLRSIDRLVAQAYARALQAYHRGQWEPARRLLEVVLDIEPDNPTVQMDHLRVLVQLGDPTAITLGDRLLERLLNDGDTVAVASMHMTLAIAEYRLRADAPRSRAHLDKGLHLLGEEPADDTVVHLYTFAAGLLLDLGEGPLARTLLQRCVHTCRQTGNQLKLRHATCALATVEAVEGDLTASRALYEQALAQSVGAEFVWFELALRLNLAEACAALGDAADAMRHCDATLAMIPRTPGTAVLARNVCQACIRYAECGQLERIERLLALCEAPNREQPPDVEMNLRLAHAQRCVCLRDFDAVATQLREALDLALETQHIFDARQYVPLLLHNELRARRPAQAERLADHYLGIAALENTPEIRGMRLQAQAQLRHAAGEGEEAERLISQAVWLMPPSRWSMLARLDAAWLMLRRGDAAAARRRLAETFNWPHGHPAGLVMQAQMEAARGDLREALHLLARAEQLDPTLRPLRPVGIATEDTEGALPAWAAEQFPSCL